MKHLRAFAFGLAALCLTTLVAVAQPFPESKTTASPNIAYTYTVKTTGGSGAAGFAIPSPPTGYYYVSFAADFQPLGTTAAPESFSCVLIVDSSTTAQSTAYSGSTGGWYIGVSAATEIQVRSKTTLNINCGTADSATWTWAVPLKVTLLKIDGHVGGNLPVATVVGVMRPVTGDPQLLGRVH